MKQLRWVSTNGQWQITQETLGGLAIVNTRTGDGWGISFCYGSPTLDHMGGKRIPAYVINAAETVWNTCR